MWLLIEGEPARIYYADPEILPNLDPATARHAALASVGDIREDTEGETGNVSVGLSISARAHFTNSPIGCIARIQSEAGDEFVGTLKKITVTTAGPGISLSIEQ
jgi:hypothetical protein